MIRLALTLVAVAFFAALVLAFAPAGSPFGIPESAFRTDIDGTSGDDVLNGTDEYDEIRGGEGNDEIRGFGAPDNLWGGDQGDFIKGGGGDDALYGGGGWDNLNIASDDSGGDFASCGDGEDNVRADPSDAVGLSCETIDWVF